MPTKPAAATASPDSRNPTAEAAMFYVACLKTSVRPEDRLSGLAMDPLALRPDYDPRSAAISAAPVAAFNGYARDMLHYDDGGPSTDGYTKYKQIIQIILDWSFTHQPPNATYLMHGVPDVLPDLAAAMKYKPKLKVQLNHGYVDLGTPCFGGAQEMRHLPIPIQPGRQRGDQAVPVGPHCDPGKDALKLLHDNAADFIRCTDNQKN